MVCFSFHCFLVQISVFLPPHLCIFLQSGGDVWICICCLWAARKFPLTSWWALLPSSLSTSWCCILFLQSAVIHYSCCIAFQMLDISLARDVHQSICSPMWYVCIFCELQHEAPHSLLTEGLWFFFFCFILMDIIKKRIINYSSTTLSVLPLYILGHSLWDASLSSEVSLEFCGINLWLFQERKKDSLHEKENSLHEKERLLKWILSLVQS